MGVLTPETPLDPPLEPFITWTDDLYNQVILIFVSLFKKIELMPVLVLSHLINDHITTFNLFALSHFITYHYII